MNRTPRLVLPDLPAGGGRLTLDAEASHRLGRVLRLAPGQSLEVLDGRGGRAEARLAEAGRAARLELQPRRQEAPPAPLLEAWLPLLKPERLEWAAEKLCELGVASITLYVSEFTGNQRRAPDLSRLGRILDAALEQSGNPWRPQLHGPRRLEELLEPADAPPLLVAERRQESLREIPWRAGDGRLALLAGPEGGFSGDERRRLGKRAAAFTCLGPHVLRAETALVALAGLARAMALPEGRG